uniref:INO80 complex subunit D-like n=1 Tax=Sinocyclocheilus anshuiensis TaxID=1608454 RepID=A0A671RVS6_9TELE
MYEGKHIHFSEVDNKPLCSYSPKLCKQRRLNGYAFCIRHVLEDKTAPFKQCEYVAKYNSQRCTNPIPKAEERRYCNSHLQVLGFIPKKERKKKQDALEEVRACAHVESVALNITVPSLALRDTNGLDGLPPSPPCSRLTPMPLSDSDILDPFAFYEEDTDREESVVQKSSSKRKLPSRPVIGLRVTAWDPEHRQPDIEHFSAVTEPCTLPTSPHLPQPPPPPAPPPPQSSTLLCKPAPPQTGPSVLSGLLPSAGVQNQPVSRRPVPAASPHPPAAQDCPQPRAVAMRPTAFTAPPVCLLRLQHLVQLYAQRQREHGDLFPHLGLDWSEDSTNDEDTEELVPLLPQAWRLQERSSLQSSSNEKPLSRQARLAQLCTYLQERYKHLCRQDRAATRHSRYRYAFRKALLHAASKDPDCTAQLIQKLSKSSQTSTCSHKYERTMCTGTTKGQSCSNIALPFSRHCFQHILLNRSQQLFSSCTARFADGQQCSVPVFDITHQTPLCDEHAKKMDNFLRGDGNRRSQQQQLRRPRKKTKPPALTKKHKKKRRLGPRRPQKPIPPAVPQGNLLMPSLSLPTHHAHVRCISCFQMHHSLASQMFRCCISKCVLLQIRNTNVVVKTNPAQFGNLLSAETHLLSTALSTPPSTSHSTILQPTAALSALPQPGLTGLTSPSSSPSSRDLLTPTQPKLQLPQFSAAFGHQLASHSGIPKDLQPSHSSTAPPTGFTITSATAATPPFPQSN